MGIAAGDPLPSARHADPALDTPKRLNVFNSLTIRNDMDIMALPFIGPLRFRRTPT